MSGETGEILEGEGEGISIALPWLVRPAPFMGIIQVC